MRRLLFLLPLAALACGEKEPEDTGEVVEEVDADGDGVSEDEDCDDADPNNFPGNAETCDDADNDCDGVADNGVLETFYGDADGDGFGAADVTVEACEAPVGHADNGDDCDDGDGDVHPDAVEVCDGGDNDCDGLVDDDDDDLDQGTATRFWADTDGDGYGATDDFALTCVVQDGYVDNDLDCDDGDASVNPGVDELCDGQDTDCDGQVDEDDAADAATWYADNDQDGYGDAADPTLACTQPSGYVADDSDCDPDDAEQYPDAPEYCNGEDDDCDGDTDEDSSVDALTWYADSDNDGYGDASSTTDACTQPSGYVADDTDCDPAESTTYPGAPETPADGVDQDCDSVDTCWTDSDGDGYGDPNATQDDNDLDCSNDSSGESDNDDDCDDSDDQVNPDGVEVCDGVDNDCDSSTSEAGTASWIDTNGVSDFTSSVNGTSGSPSTVTLVDDGDLVFCSGTYYVNIDVQASDVAIYGASGSPADVILDGDAADSVIKVDTDGVDVYVADLSLTNGYGPSSSRNSSGAGGGFRCESSSSFELENLWVYENYGYLSSGVHSTGCDGVMTGVEVYDNDAAYEGGVGLWDGTHVVYDTLITGNQATKNIGGLLLGGTVTLDEVLVTGNTAGGIAGGVYLYSGASVTWSGTSSTNSGITANSDGSYGGLYVASGTLSGTVIDFGTSSNGDANSPQAIRLGNGNTYDPGDDVTITCSTSTCTW